MPSVFTLEFGVGITGRTGPCERISEEGMIGGCVAEDARIASRLRTAALTDASKPFFTRADRYSSKARSDRRTGEDESYSRRSELLFIAEHGQVNIRIQTAVPILK